MENREIQEGNCIKTKDYHGKGITKLCNGKLNGNHLTKQHLKDIQCEFE